MASKRCGSCTLCCKLMGVEELTKPIDVWCEHCDLGVGCSIYAARPKSCQDFECLWLVDESIPNKLRPDRSKVVLHADSTGRRIVARCDPANPLAWMREPMYTGIKHQAIAGWAAGIQVVAAAGLRVWIITPGPDIDLGQVGHRSPIAAWENADGSFGAKALPPIA